MPIIRNPAIILHKRNHGEHGAIIRAMSRDYGLVAGYVAGARSRNLRPILLTGNHVRFELHNRENGQLARMSVELEKSRAPFYSEALPAAAIDWACLATVRIMPEGEPALTMYEALFGLLELICAAPSARWWASAMAQYELKLLDQLGVSLALDRCAQSGTHEDLHWVSPKSGCAISIEAAKGWQGRLLPLPHYLRPGGAFHTMEWQEILQGLELSGYFLNRRFIIGDHADMAPVRDRLVSRLFKLLD